MQIDSDINSTLFSRFPAAGLRITAFLNYVCHRFKQMEQEANLYYSVCFHEDAACLHLEVVNLPCFKVTILFLSSATGCSSFRFVDCIIWA